MTTSSTIDGCPGSLPDPAERRAVPTVLVVDDDPILRELIRVELTESGFEVWEAHDAAAAQGCVLQQQPDVALVDILLPGTSGLELTAWLRAQPAMAQLPVIVLTGLDHDEVIGLAFEAGATDFVRKPMEPRLLRHRVQLALRARGQRAALQRSEADLAEAQAIAGIGSFSWVVGEPRLHASAELAGLLGNLRRAGSLLIADLVSAIHPADRERVCAPDALGWPGGGSGGYEGVLRVLREGEPARWVQLRLRYGTGPDGVARLTGTLQDITEQRERQQRIEYLATHDPETDLPNTAGFIRMVEAVTGGSGGGVVLQIGIEGVERLQGRLGPERTVQLMRAIGQRLRLPADGASWCDERVPAVVARNCAGGFALLYDRLPDAAAAQRVAEANARLFADPVPVDGHPVRVQARVGIARSPDDGHSPTELLRSADAALQHARRSGARVRFHERMITEDGERHLWLERELSQALEAGDLALAFQPKFDSDGRIAGVEALSRWHHAEAGAISPAEFIAVAEESGLIHALGAWALRSAIAQAATWWNRGYDLPVAVNLSAAQVLEPGIARSVTEELRATGLPGHLLELEITESILLAECTAVCDTLSELAATGARIALDDFGTGYSSLSYLTNLPLDVLKIDRSFVERLPQVETVAVMQAIVTLSKGLGLVTVAEGVETDEQARWLRAAGCELLQGFHLARPLPAEGIDELLDPVSVLTA